jgi:hypothetical protein
MGDSGGESPLNAAADGLVRGLPLNGEPGVAYCGQAVNTASRRRCEGPRVASAGPDRNATVSNRFIKGEAYRPRPSLWR